MNTLAQWLTSRTACALAALVATGEVGAAVTGAGTYGLLGERPLKVWLTPETADRYKLTFDNGWTADLDRGDAGRASLSLDGVLVGFSPLAYLSVVSDCQSLLFKSAECEDWVATVPCGVQVMAKVVPGQPIVDIVSPPANVRPVQLRLCDGGQAWLRPGSMIRYEGFKDGTYYVFGGGNVNTINADGKNADLTPQTPILIGGPLTRGTAADGSSSLKRASPITQVLVSGDVNSRVTASAGGQTVIIQRDSPQTLSLPNGSVLALALNPETRTLDWRVEKGFFEVQIDGVEGYKAVGLTGQAVSQQWDPALQAVSVQNRTSSADPGVPSTLLAAVSSQLFVRIDPRATFLLNRLEGVETFSTSAAGGVVSLYNAATKQETDLSGHSILFVSGRPGVGDGGQIANARRVLVAGEKTGLELSGDLGSYRLVPGDFRTLIGDKGGKLEARFNDQGELVLRAVDGRYVLITKLDTRVAIRIEEGSAVILVLDERQGVATVRADPGNRPGGASFAFVGGVEGAGDPSRGSGVVLQPNSPLTIALGRGGLANETTGTMVFYEAAGAGGANTGLAQGSAPIGGASFGELGRQIDASRILEPPISSKR